jgi:transposase-like protein
MTKPKSANSFHHRFRSEEACVAFLEQVRWNGEPVCPRCGCLRVYRITTRKNYSCSGCRRTFTVRYGTIFEDSKLPLQTWFTAVWLVTTARAGISSIELGEKLGISQQAAWFVLHRIQYCADYGSAQMKRVSPLTLDMTFDEFMAKAVLVPSPAAAKRTPLASPPGPGVAWGS